MPKTDLDYYLQTTYDPQSKVIHLGDSRNRGENNTVNLFFGSSSLLKQVDFTKLETDVPVDFVLAAGSSREVWTRIVVAGMNYYQQEGRKVNIIFDVGYELVEELTPFEIREFGGLLKAYVEVAGHKLALATMTIVPDLQKLQDNILEINKEFNRWNISMELTPHYGVRSVMKYHKKSGSYKIRPSVWEEWKNNASFGRSLTKEGAITYIKYQIGYFRRGFEGTDREANIETRVKKDQSLNVPDFKVMDLRVLLTQKRKESPGHKFGPDRDAFMELISKYLEQGMAEKEEEQVKKDGDKKRVNVLRQGGGGKKKKNDEK